MRYVVLASVRVVPEIILHAHTVDARRHDVCPCAVSIENMISGDGEERLPLRHPKGWREQRGYAAEQIPSFQRFQGACWSVVFFPCISLLHGEESHGDAQPYPNHP